jgi:uncharacterized membrane protein
MNKPSGTARTIGGTVLLASMILQHFGIDFEVSEADVTKITEAAGALVLAYGVVVNWIKRVSTVVGKK